MNSGNNKTRVTILTGTYRIKGYIDLIPGARLTDFLAEAREFIAVTDAEITEIGGRVVQSEPFLDVGRSQIHAIFPRH